MTGSSPDVVRAPGWYYFVPTSLVVNGLLNLPRPWAAVFVAAGLVSFAVILRSWTVAGDDGLTAVRPLRRRRLAWAEVAALQRYGGGVCAVTSSGERVVLPYVTWRAPGPDAHAQPRSAQGVALRARAAGWEIPLDG